MSYITKIIQKDSRERNNIQKQIKRQIIINSHIGQKANGKIWEIKRV